MLMSKVTMPSRYMKLNAFVSLRSFSVLPFRTPDREELIALIKGMTEADIAQYIPLAEDDMFGYVPTE